jgi:hypothetical protein
MKQEDQRHNDQDRDVTDDQRDEPAGAEFVPLLEAVKSAEESAGAIDAAAVVVVRG